VQWADTNGDHYAYFDETGTLQMADDFDPQIITLYAFVAFIYWDNVNQESILFLDERHGNVMSSTTHSYLHNTRGTQYDTGLALSNMVVDGDGSSDTHVQFGVTDGVVWDEDIRAAITDGSPQDIAPIAQVPIFYLEQGGEWRRDVATNYPVVTTGVGRLAYNEFTGVVWQKTEVTNNQFVVYHYFASTDTRTPIFGIMGQATYTGVSAAQEGALTEILNLELGALGSLSTEWVAIASVIYQTSNSYSNAVKARIRSTADAFDYIDWRDTSRTAGGSTASNTSWGSITGTLSNQTDLQAELDAKSDTTHTHTLADVSDSGNLAALDTVTLADVSDSGDLAALDTVGSDEIENFAVIANKIGTGAVAAWNLNSSLEQSLLYDDRPFEPFMPWVGEVVSQYGWSNRRHYNPFQLDRFLGRGSELAMDLDGTPVGASNIQNLTNQSYANALNIAVAGGNTGVLTIDMVTNGLVSSDGFTYAQGYIMLTFYSGRGPVSMSARTQDKNGTWTARTCLPHMTSSVNPGVTESVWWSVQPNGNYITKIEITMTSQSGTICGLGNISYLGTRMTMAEGPSITPYGGTFYNTISGARAGVENWSIDQDGTASFDTLTVDTTLTIPAGSVDTAELAAGSVTNTEAADMAGDTIKGRATSTGDPQDLTASQARAILNVEDGAAAPATIRPADQFLDLTGGSEAVYTVYGVTNDWYATKSTSSGMTTSADQTTALPNLTTLQGLTYS
jgi:hypothetical protein